MDEGSKQAAKSKRRMQAAGVSRIPPRKRPRTKDDDEDENDLGNKLALTGLKPWAESRSPCGAKNIPNLFRPTPPRFQLGPGSLLHIGAERSPISNPRTSLP
jgi:hypothetical protein